MKSLSGLGRRLSITIVVFTSVWLHWLPTAWSAAPTMEQFVDAHRKQLEVLQSLYVEHDTHVETVGQLADIRKYLFVKFVQDFRTEFAFKDNMRFASTHTNRTYIDIDKTLASGDVTEVVEPRPGREWTFDGKVSYMHQGTPAYRKKPAAMITPIERDEDGISYFAQEYLGLSIRRLPHVRNGEQDIVNQSIIALIDQGKLRPCADREELDGVSCFGVEWNDIVTRYTSEETKIQQPVKHTLLCDPGLNFAVRKHDVYLLGASQALSERTILSDFTEVADGVWLPKHGTYERFATPESPAELHNTVLLREHYQVTAIHANDVDEAIFTPVIAPRTIVTDARYIKSGEPILYTMPATQDELEGVIEAALKGKRFTPEKRSLVRRMSLGVVLLINCVAFVSIVAYLMKKRSSSQAK